MDLPSPEVVETLKAQRRFHQEQIRLIDIALAAIEAHPSEAPAAPAENDRRTQKVKKHRIQWTREIEGFLDDYNEFTIMDLQRDLSEKRNIGSAMTIQGRNVINNTLNRFEKKGRIRKTSPGVYQVVKESLPS